MQFEHYVKLAKTNKKLLIKKLKKEMKKEGLVFKTLSNKVNNFCSDYDKIKEINRY